MTLTTQFLAGVSSTRLILDMQKALIWIQDLIRSASNNQHRPENVTEPEQWRHTSFFHKNRLYVLNKAFHD